MRFAGRCAPPSRSRRRRPAYDVQVVVVDDPLAHGAPRPGDRRRRENPLTAKNSGILIGLSAAVTHSQASSATPSPPGTTIPYCLPVTWCSTTRRMHTPLATSGHCRRVVESVMPPLMRGFALWFSRRPECRELSQASQTSSGRWSLFSPANVRWPSNSTRPARRSDFAGVHVVEVAARGPVGREQVADAEHGVRRRRHRRQSLGRRLGQPHLGVRTGVEVVVAGADRSVPANGATHGSSARAGSAPGRRCWWCRAAGWSRSAIFCGRWVSITDSSRPVSPCRSVTRMM